jgi:enoyl-[acyl-carrier protein] reductase I
LIADRQNIVANIMQIITFATVLASAVAFAPSGLRARIPSSKLSMQGDGLKIDMRGKKVFVAGVADSTGYGWAIAKACAEAGATVLLGTWPPVFAIFEMGIERGQFDEDQKLLNGAPFEISKVCRLNW